MSRSYAGRIRRVNAALKRVYARARLPGEIGRAQHRARRLVERITRHGKIDRGSPPSRRARMSAALTRLAACFASGRHVIRGTPARKEAALRIRLRRMAAKKYLTIGEHGIPYERKAAKK